MPNDSFVTPPLKHELTHVNTLRFSLSEMSSALLSYQEAEATKYGCRACLGLSHQMALSYSLVSLLCVCMCVCVCWIESRQAGSLSVRR